ncbi:MAG TPA: putative dsRNA-binding protein, partial [Caulobacter sp.]|nr:putative dsRNA-binding protein [Caulobacter sp.]
VSLSQRLLFFDARDAAQVAAMRAEGENARYLQGVTLPPALRLSGSATKIGARESDGVLGDACEALMAALYLDGGLEVARTFFNDAWQEEFDNPAAGRDRDPKTQLQEWAQARGLPLPGYSVVRRTGPDHAPTFTVAVTIDGFDAERGEGRSRQEAEKAAALAMLVRREA